MAKKIEAPIFTADGVQFEIGMVVYGFDESCKTKPEVKDHLVRLVVSEVDTGRARMVRLRKPDGREWRWSAEVARDVCSNDRHLVYSSLDKLKKLALPIIRKKEKERIEASIKAERASIKYKQKQIAEDEADIAKYEAELAEITAGLEIMKTLTVADYE